MRDETGRALVGAVVQIEDHATLQIRSFITQRDGTYHFGNLSEDLTYHVRARYQGATSKKHTFSKYSSRKTAVIDLTIDRDH